MSEPLRLHRMAWPVRNLGPGERLALWTQGCRLNCPGCCSVNSHDLQGGVARGVADWLATVEGMLRGAAPQGLTISGGEPTLQPAAVREFIAACRERHPGIDVLLYSGLPWQAIQEGFPELVSSCDVMVREPYLERVPPRCSLHGSGNQTIHLLTPLAKRRYLRRRVEDPNGVLVVTSVTGSPIFAVGIPSQLQQLTERLAERGITLQTPSWRS